MTKRLNSRSGKGLAVAAMTLVVAAVSAAAGVWWGGRAPAAAAPRAAASTSGQLWTCSMHPEVIREEPGLCPICHMRLTPINGARGGEVGAEGVVVIDPAVVQNMGVRTEAAALGPVERSIETVGTLMEREPDLTDINLRVSGWIEHLYANTDGMEIRKGEPLFDLYSPELSQALEELIAARRETQRQTDPGARATAEALLGSSRSRLARLGLEPGQIAALEALDAAPRIVTFLSPRSGHVRDKANLNAGSAVRSGQLVMRITDPSVLWLEARVFERDLGLVRVGQRVEARIDAFPGRTFAGLVSQIHPHLDEATRAGVVRINVGDEEVKLREGMFASVRIRADPGPESVLIPREAVVDTGPRQIVFVDLGRGRFEPRAVAIGMEDDEGRVQVLKGVAAGDRLVVSGQFLLDSESRLREAVRKFAFAQASAPGPDTAGPPAAAAQLPSAVPASPMLASRIDAVYSSYLALAATLGGVQHSQTPVEPAGLILAAKAMQGAGATEQDRALAGELLAAAQSLSGRALAEQRQGFKPLGAAMVKLALAHPPSMRVAPRLYHMHCPMAPGDWLQTTDTIANPFYADEMKECGEIVEEIPARPQGAAPR